MARFTAYTGCGREEAVGYLSVYSYNFRNALLEWESDCEFERVTRELEAAKRNGNGSGGIRIEGEGASSSKNSSSVGGGTSVSVSSGGMGETAIYMGEALEEEEFTHINQVPYPVSNI